MPIVQVERVDNVGKYAIARLPNNATAKLTSSYIRNIAPGDIVLVQRSAIGPYEGIRNVGTYGYHKATETEREALFAPEQVIDIILHDNVTQDMLVVGMFKDITELIPDSVASHMHVEKEGTIMDNSGELKKVYALLKPHEKDVETIKQLTMLGKRYVSAHFRNIYNSSQFVSSMIGFLSYFNCAEKTRRHAILHVLGS